MKPLENLDPPLRTENFQHKRRHGTKNSAQDHTCLWSILRYQNGSGRDQRGFCNWGIRAEVMCLRKLAPNGDMGAGDAKTASKRKRQNKF